MSLYTYLYLYVSIHIRDWLKYFPFPYEIWAESNKLNQAIRTLRIFELQEVVSLQLSLSNKRYRSLVRCSEIDTRELCLAWSFRKPTLWWYSWLFSSKISVFLSKFFITDFCYVDLFFWLGINYLQTTCKVNIKKFTFDSSELLKLAFFSQNSFWAN